MVSEQPSPPGWKDSLERTLDLDAAYRALDEYHHFHTYTLKGTLRYAQLRLEEALLDFGRAEEAFLMFDPSPENNRLYGLLRGWMLSARLFQEAMDASSVAMSRTDQELDRFLSVENLNPVDRDKNVGFYSLVRGEYQSALDMFEAVIEATRNPPERSIGAYICAAAAAHELGFYKRARRHYENAELTICCHCNRILFCIFLSWLLALTTHWGWQNEAQRWTDTLEALECPESTRSCLFRRARLMEDISSTRTVLLA